MQWYQMQDMSFLGKRGLCESLEAKCLGYQLLKQTKSLKLYVAVSVLSDEYAPRGLYIVSEEAINSLNNELPFSWKFSCVSLLFLCPQETIKLLTSFF